MYNYEFNYIKEKIIKSLKPDAINEQNFLICRK